ncbi:NAD+ synthase [Lysobacteraceae bacterium NML75-0749]|nr:NAD+ synthase [Xanthomonadaceae bacterium NML91-0268]PJK03530.1 NAD+ synthase [Xanthomonadaceae bacterium NML75-0749]
MSEHSPSLRIALAQFDFPIGDIEGNRERIAAMLAEARDEYGADVVVFPALALSGAVPQDLLLRPAFLRDCAAALQSLATQCQGITALLGWPEAANGRVYHSISVLADGQLQKTFRKRVLGRDAGLDECRYFSLDPEAGDSVLEINGVRAGVLMGEELDNAGLVERTVNAGAQLLLVAAASPFAHEKHAERDALLSVRSRSSGVGIAYVNAVGGQDALLFDGASLVADGDGTVHPAAAAFTDQWLVVDYAVDGRSFLPMQWVDDGDESRDALVWRGIVRGIRDYCGKNGFKTAWLGLSGGLDSAVVLALAAEALGAENVTAVRMPSRYTAGLSNDLAEEQCRALGVKLLALPIEKPFQAYLDTLAEAFAGKAADVTEENLQSRVRGTLMMALTNKFGGLLLTTGNKSEYAVGYATIYGDMNGGYAPLKDLYKTEVFALARWRNTVGGLPAGSDGVIPPAVIARPPSAELRENQKDQDSLPPYDVLDGILRRLIEGQESCEDIIAAGFSKEVVERVARLVRISEWKRQQAAIGPRLSRHAFGDARRYPVSHRYWR